MFCFVDVFLYFVYIIVFLSVLPFGVINDNNTGPAAEAWLGTLKKNPYIHGYFVASFRYFSGTG